MANPDAETITDWTESLWHAITILREIKGEETTATNLEALACQISEEIINSFG